MFCRPAHHRPLFQPRYRSAMRRACTIAPSLCSRRYRPKLAACPAPLSISRCLDSRHSRPRPIRTASSRSEQVWPASMPALTRQASLPRTPGVSGYAPSSDTADLLVQRGIVNLTWNEPAPITYGTALGGGQLNAVADAPGTYTYSPPAGTISPVALWVDCDVYADGYRELSFSRYAQRIDHGDGRANAVCEHGLGDAWRQPQRGDSDQRCRASDRLE